MINCNRPFVFKAELQCMTKRKLPPMKTEWIPKYCTYMRLILCTCLAKFFSMNSLACSRMTTS